MDKENPSDRIPKPVFTGALFRPMLANVTLLKLWSILSNQFNYWRKKYLYKISLNTPLQQQVLGNSIQFSVQHTDMQHNCPLYSNKQLHFKDRSLVTSHQILWSNVRWGMKARHSTFHPGLHQIKLCKHLELRRRNPQTRIHVSHGQLKNRDCVLTKKM